MDNQMLSANVDADSYEDKEQLLEKGRQLHNQAVREIFAMIAKSLTRPLKRGLGNPSKDRGLEYLYGKLPAGE